MNIWQNPLIKNKWATEDPGRHQGHLHHPKTWPKNFPSTLTKYLPCIRSNEQEHFFRETLEFDWIVKIQIMTSIKKIVALNDKLLKFIISLPPSNSQNIFCYCVIKTFIELFIHVKLFSIIKQLRILKLQIVLQ